MQPALAPAPHMMRPSAQDSEQALREQLLHHVNDPSGQQRSLDPQVHSPPGSSVNHAHNIDPAIAGPGMISHSPGESGGDDPAGSENKRGGKRELSTSKRAAQNRQAQRAFRQRKEGHIKKLEEQVRDYQLLTENYKAVQAENYQLRDYIINLQSRLIESQGNFPPAPSNINLQQPAVGGPAAAQPGEGRNGESSGVVPQQGQSGAPTAPMAGAALSMMQAGDEVKVERGGVDPQLHRP
ncbi:MAG: hypothetical protein LQ340_004474 [Diploschistes diacapsis]|nr:MAG: hypothetical protein LQ340_004474 [Diploschistes diacapsis]